MTGGGFTALQGGTSTQVLAVSEVYMGGQAGASSPSFMLLSRDSTVGATPVALSTGNSNAALHTATANFAAPQTGFISATTQPQRNATLGLLNLSFNAFGGIVRWVAYPGEELWMLGSAASFGEVSLSAYSGGTPGLMGSHIIYEMY
jgi:hypothetical protein